MGFELSAAFDSDPNRVGTIAGGVAVSDAAEMENVLTERPAELAILAVPAQQAAETGERLMTCGIQGILNFAPTTLRLPSNVAVVNVDLASELQRLAFSVQSHR